MAGLLTTRPSARWSATFAVGVAGSAFAATPVEMLSRGVSWDPISTTVAGTARRGVTPSTAWCRG